jgi:hypothetical protein
MAGATTSSKAVAKQTGKAAKSAKMKPESAHKSSPSGALRTKSGEILTPEVEADLVAEAEAGYDVSKLVARRAPGRPSLSRHGGKSHRISVRVDDETFEMIQRVADNVGRRPSELIREVLRAAYAPK